MKRPVIIALIVAATALCGLPAHAVDQATQDHINQLQAQIDALEAQAAQFRGSIAEQQAKGATLKAEIGTLQNQIGAVQSQIAATDTKIDKTKLEMGSVQDQIDQTLASIDQRKGSIARMVFFLDQADHESVVASLFKYANLSDFFQQIHDVSNVQDTVMQAVADLKDAKMALEGQQVDLQSKQDQLQNLKDQAAEDKAALDDVKYQKDKLLKTTKGQEALFQKQLSEIEKKEAAFFKEQQKLESQIVAGGLYIVHITATSVPRRGTKLFTKPEDHPALTQGFGMTSYARRGAYGGQPHNGVDFATGYGTPIKAIGPGKLIARGNNDGWGNWMAIQHPNNMVSLYGHLSRFNSLVTVGSVVTQGQVIGYEGNTGNVTGSHVHLSLYKDFFTYVNDKNGTLNFNYWDGALNPLDYL